MSLLLAHVEAMAAARFVDGSLIINPGPTQPESAS